MTDATTPAPAKAPKPYPALSGTFLKGNLKGQVASVYKDRVTKPEKVADFKKAIADGQISLGQTVLSKSVATKLIEIGVDVPKNLLPAAPAA